MDREIKLAKIKAHSQDYQATLTVARDLLGNPVAEIIGGVALVEYLGRTPAGHPLFSQTAQNRLELLLAVAVMMQQLGADNTAKLATSLGGGIKDIVLAPVDMVAKLIPAALAAA